MTYGTWSDETKRAAAAARRITDKNADEPMNMTAFIRDACLVACAYLDGLEPETVE